MKSLLSLVTLLSFFLAVVAFQILPPQKGQVQLVCKVNSCDKVDSLYLFEFNGVNFVKIKAAPTADFQNYQFDMPATTAPRFYYAGRDPNNAKPLILGTEEKITLSGSCPQFQAAQLLDSELNTKYEELKNTLNQQKNELSQLLQQLQVANSQDNIDLANAAIIKLAQLDQRCLDLLESLKKSHPYLSKIAALNTYLSYQNHGSGDMSEIEYFATRFFQKVDWNDPDYNYMPWVYESIKGYSWNAEPKSATWWS